MVYLWAVSEIIGREGSVASKVADDNDWELRFEWKREGAELGVDGCGDWIHGSWILGSMGTGRFTIRFVLVEFLWQM